MPHMLLAFNYLNYQHKKTFTIDLCASCQQGLNYATQLPSQGILFNKHNNNNNNNNVASTTIAQQAHSQTFPKGSVTPFLGHKVSFH